MNIYDEMLEISKETLEHSQGLKNILNEYIKEKSSIVAESMSEGLPIIEFIDESTEFGNALRVERQTAIDSPAKESANAKKRAEEKNASRQGLNKNKSKGQRNR